MKTFRQKKFCLTESKIFAGEDFSVSSFLGIKKS